MLHASSKRLKLLSYNSSFIYVEEISGTELLEAKRPAIAHITCTICKDERRCLQLLSITLPIQGE